MYSDHEISKTAKKERPITDHGTKVQTSRKGDVTNVVTIRVRHLKNKVCNIKSKDLPKMRERSSTTTKREDWYNLYKYYR